MIVVDHEPQSWFLLQEGASLLFDVNCSHGAVSYSWLMALNAEEMSRFIAEGRPYLNALAETVQWSAPGVRGSKSVLRGRNISEAMGQAVSEAIKSWRIQGSTSNG